MTTKIQLRRAIDGGMEDVNPMTSEDCVMLEDGKKLKEVIDFVTTTEDFEDEDIVVEENLVDRVESIENRIGSEFEQQNSQIATGLSNIKTIEQNINNKVDSEVAKVNAQLSKNTNEIKKVEVIANTSQITEARIPNSTISSSKLKTTYNTDRIGLVNLQEEVIQAIAGNAPVNQIPADGSVTIEKLTPTLQNIFIEEGGRW